MTNEPNPSANVDLPRAKLVQKKAEEPKKPHKPRVPSGPGLNVTAFVGLMRKLETASANLTGDQIRFIQLSIQRFEHDQQGIVKTKLALLRPKKEKVKRQIAGPSTTQLPHTDASSDALLERLTHVSSEEEVIRAIEGLPDARAEQMAKSQGLRNTSPAQARQKLLETVMTLRQMSRIQNAGKKGSHDENQKS